MAVPEKREPLKPKAEPGWSLVLNVARVDGEEGGETALAWRARLTPLDLALAAAAFILLVVEPLAVTALLKRVNIPMLAEACAPNQQVVVLHAPQEGPPEHAAGGAPGHEEGGQSDLITPLNFRDPSNLVMTPYDATERARLAQQRAAADDSWKEALRAAAGSAAKTARPKPKPAAEDGR